jgi:hypothetical protein
MAERDDGIFEFLEASGLEPKRVQEKLVQFWYKEERYYCRFVDQKQAVRIFNPRVWRVETHEEFGIATFVANNMNRDTFGAKLFMNEVDDHVYIVADIFFAELETLRLAFIDYMNAMNWAIGEFRDRAEAATEGDSHPELPDSG